MKGPLSLPSVQLHEERSLSKWVVLQIRVSPI